MLPRQSKPRTVVPSDDISSDTEIDAFIRAASQPQAARGRLIFALDATMSRQPTWDLACSQQAAMFDAAAGLGGLTVRLAYFRGTGEAKASRWVSDPAQLSGMMARIACAGGRTQIRRMLSLAERDAAEGKLAAMIYVGDCMEEDADDLCDRAGRLALHGVKVFMFHEGADRTAERVFREIARLTGGVYRRFDATAPEELRALLQAVAVYAAGGRKALAAERGAVARALLADLP
jgi:hypothetical protein